MKTLLTLPLTAYPLLLATVLVQLPSSARAAPTEDSLTCISIPEIPTACEGFLMSVDKKAFLKKWPSRVGVRLTMQKFPVDSTANHIVYSAVADIFQLVTDGQQKGLWPIYVVQHSVEVDTNSNTHFSFKTMGFKMGERVTSGLKSEEFSK